MSFDALFPQKCPSCPCCLSNSKVVQSWHILSFFGFNKNISILHHLVVVYNSCLDTFLAVEASCNLRYRKNFLRNRNLELHTLPTKGYLSDHRSPLWWILMPFHKNVQVAPAVCPTQKLCNLDTSLSIILTTTFQLYMFWWWCTAAVWSDFNQYVEFYVAGTKWFFLPPAVVFQCLPFTLFTTISFSWEIFSASSKWPWGYQMAVSQSMLESNEQCPYIFDRKFQDPRRKV